MSPVHSLHIVAGEDLACRPVMALRRSPRPFLPKRKFEDGCGEPGGRPQSVPCGQMGRWAVVPLAAPCLHGQSMNALRSSVSTWPAVSQQELSDLGVGSSAEVICGQYGLAERCRQASLQQQALQATAFAEGNVIAASHSTSFYYVACPRAASHSASSATVASCNTLPNRGQASRAHPPEQKLSRMVTSGLVAGMTAEAQSRTCLPSDDVLAGGFTPQVFVFHENGPVPEASRKAVLPPPSPLPGIPASCNCIAAQSSERSLREAKASQHRSASLGPPLISGRGLLGDRRQSEEQERESHAILLAPEGHSRSSLHRLGCNLSTKRPELPARLCAKCSCFACGSDRVNASDACTTTSILQQSAVIAGSACPSDISSNSRRAQSVEVSRKCERLQLKSQECLVPESHSQSRATPSIAVLRVSPELSRLRGLMERRSVESPPASTFSEAGTSCQNPSVHGIGAPSLTGGSDPSGSSLHSTSVLFFKSCPSACGEWSGSCRKVLVNSSSNALSPLLPLAQQVASLRARVESWAECCHAVPDIKVLRQVPLRAFLHAWAALAQIGRVSVRQRGTANLFDIGVAEADDAECGDCRSAVSEMSVSTPKTPICKVQQSRVSSGTSSDLTHMDDDLESLDGDASLSLSSMISLSSTPASISPRLRRVSPRQGSMGASLDWQISRHSHLVIPAPCSADHTGAQTSVGKVMCSNAEGMHGSSFLLSPRTPSPCSIRAPSGTHSLTSSLPSPLRQAASESAVKSARKVTSADDSSASLGALRRRAAMLSRRLLHRERQCMALEEALWQGSDTVSIDAGDLSSDDVSSHHHSAKCLEEEPALRERQRMR